MHPLTVELIHTQVTGGRGATASKAAGGSRAAEYLTAAARIAVAVLVFDAYRYAWHRLAHINRFIYRHLHSWRRLGPASPPYCSPERAAQLLAAARLRRRPAPRAPAPAARRPSRGRN